MELNIYHQFADRTIQGKDALPSSSREGELLVNFGHFPRSHRLSASEVVDRRAGAGAQDTHRCTGCHKDTGPGQRTHGALGELDVNVGEEKVRALVLPYYRQPGGQAEMDLYCVPSDLMAMYRCQCGTASEKSNPLYAPFALPASHRSITASAEEGCRRLKAVLDLKPTQHCQFDPRTRKEEPGPCLHRGSAYGDVATAPTGSGSRD